MRYFLPALLVGCAWPVLSTTSAAGPDAAGIEFFENKIRPVLVEHCYSCHSVQTKKKRGGLYLDSRAAMLEGGDSGPALVPGNPEQSPLVKAIQHTGELAMPPKGKLSAPIIENLVRWVKMGAPAPEGAKVAVESGIDWTKARGFWSFQPIHRPAPPSVKDMAWGRNPIDRFVLARLEAEGLKPNTAANRHGLIRRLSFDLLGVPPTPEEVDAFVADARPGAYERLVDRMLASPRYGERWARHWLDVARYAEDQAHTFAVKPNTNAWRYRDWVVSALNGDVPYERFVRLQIAADQLADAGPLDRAALGFFGLGAQYYKNTAAAQAIADELDDRVDTLARGFLGLTVSCARCHDHKFDPIPTQDYYSLAGVFHSSKLAEVPLGTAEEAERFRQGQKRVQDADGAVKRYLGSQRQMMAGPRIETLPRDLLAAWELRGQKGPRLAAEAKRLGIDRGVLDRWVKLITPGSKMSGNLGLLVPWRDASRKMTKEQATKTAGEFQAQVRRVLKREVSGMNLGGQDRQLMQAILGDKGVYPLREADLPADSKAELARLRTVLAKEKKEAPVLPIAHGLAEGAPTDLKIYVRGNPANQGAVAPRRFLRILAGEEPSRFTHGSGRVDLADAIDSKDNPLTARVIVNRVWLHHFGRGIVGTPSNFGLLGERPTHPELLDWLASELIGSGWSIKHLHRLILTSAVYRMSSQPQSAGMEKDPDNRLLWRANRRRLEVEAWRDALLAVAGPLDAVLGGPTTNLAAPDNRRRTLYAKISRHDLDGLLRLFDFPDANITSEKRTETTVPQQQLFVLNSPFVIARAKELAIRVQQEAGDDAARIRRMYLLVYGRPASEPEVRLGSLYLASRDEGEEASRNQLNRWERYTQALLASNEFLYID